MFATIISSNPNLNVNSKNISKSKKNNFSTIQLNTREKKPQSIKISHKYRRSLAHHKRMASLENPFKYPSTHNHNKKSGKKNKVDSSRGVIWRANSRCLSSKLKSAIYYVARNLGRVRVNSTCRSRAHNKRVGGAKYSYHLSGKAADIRVWGNIRAAAHYLRKIAGGYKHYGGGLFHIDTGPKRSW